MNEIVELVYASRAAFTPVGGGGVEPEVSRILSQSRRNNPRHNVGGVLCYSDGHFFQCLEGAANDVEAVYRRIATDPRHQDLKLLSRRPVGERRFKSWSMKYLAVNDGIRRLLQNSGLKGFDPYSFGDDMIRRLVALLHEGTDPTAVADPQPAALETRSTAAATPRLATAALGVAMLALAVATIALYRSFG
jgi:hypothetical protein